MQEKDIKMQKSNEVLATVGKNISYLMHKKGVDGTHLSRITSVGIATINNLRKGIGNPTLATIVAIAQFFDVSLSEITAINLEKQATNPNRAKTMPLIKLNEINDFLAKTLKTHETYTTEIDTFEKKSFFAIEINNDSLYPQFSSGTVCVISQDDEPCDGDIVLVKINNYIPCFRRIFIEDEDFLFTTITLEYESAPLNYKNYDIVGILLKTIKNFS